MAAALLAPIVARDSADAHKRIRTTLSWEKDIAPIVQRRCVTRHSSGGVAIPFTTFAETVRRGRKGGSAGAESRARPGRITAVPSTAPLDAAYPLFLGRGHTASDIVVYLPKERIVATGDLIVEGTSYMGDAYVPEWIATIDALKTRRGKRRPGW